jgi:hypothetical protein
MLFMRGMGFHAFFKERDDMQASIDDKCWGWRKVLSSNQVSILPNVLSLYMYRGECPTNGGYVLMQMALSFWLGEVL